MPIVKRYIDHDVINKRYTRGLCARLCSDLKCIDIKILAKIVCQKGFGDRRMTL